MIDNQSQIIEKLRELSCDDSTKQFVLQIMEFYKGHMSKLQGIIVQKQHQIDDFFELKQRYEDRIEELLNQIEEVKENNKKETDSFWQQSEQLDELNRFINSLKTDLQNSEFDKQVLRDDIRNMQNKIDILESQLKMTMNQNVELKSELVNLKQNKPAPKPDFQTTQLLDEIKDIRSQLNNGGKVNVDQHMQSSHVSLGRRGPFEMDTSFERPLTSKKEESAPKVVNENIPEKEAKVETQDINVDELQNYLSFLQEKEKDLQNKLWKLPQRDRSVNEKKERLAMEAQLEEVFNEIQSIKQILKQSK